MQLVKLMRLETEAEDSSFLLSINSFLVLDFLKSFVEVDDSPRYFGWTLFSHKITQCTEDQKNEE